MLRDRQDISETIISTGLTSTLLQLRMNGSNCTKRRHNAIAAEDDG